MALNWGMSHNDFWYEKPYLQVSYAKAHELKLKDNTEEYKIKTNFNAWINGIYIQNAISSVFSKGSSYPSKPIELFQNKEDEELNIKNSEEEIKQRSKIIHQILNKNQSFTENH